MFEEYPLPQIPKDTPSLGWRHSRAACAVLEFQSGNAILAQVQGIRLGLTGESTQQIEHISPFVCTQQTLNTKRHSAHAKTTKQHVYFSSSVRQE